MNGYQLKLVKRMALFAAAVVYQHGMPPSVAGERRVEDQRATAEDTAIDPFAQEESANQALTGMWIYSGEFEPDQTPVRDLPGFVGPLGENAWPIADQATEKPARSDRKVSFFVRIDLCEKRRFRTEILRTDHANKVSSYTFGEGSWRLRGRVLVLTFVLDNEVTRLAFFVRKLVDNEMALDGIGESLELFQDGHGTFNKCAKPQPLFVPEGYSVDVDESSFGSPAIDVAEYLRENLNIEVETPEG